jgi:hypothetical protein
MIGGTDAHSGSQSSSSGVFPSELLVIKALPPVLHREPSLGGPGAGSALATMAPSKPDRLTVLAAHPHAPLLATGSGAQEVRIWTDAGDMVRTQASLVRAGICFPLA